MEELRERLNNLIEKYGVSCEEVLKISQQLDLIINEEQSKYFAKVI